MAVQILRGDDIACLFCPTRDMAFGPVFYRDHGKDADERAEAFLRYLGCDARTLTDFDLSARYMSWLSQEAQQYAAEAAAEEAACRA